MTTAYETTHTGFRILGLSSPALDLRCAPALGGRVFSLISRRTGREWLWRQPGGRELFVPGDPADFGTGTFAGLDECLPTIGACTMPDGRALADHGALWARPWDVEDHDETTLTLAVEAPALGLRLTRRIRVEGNVVRFDYELMNSGRGAAPALWAMHPLFTLIEGDRLELPAAIVSPLVTPPESAADGWLETLTAAGRRDGYLKGFTGALPGGGVMAALANPQTGDRLEVRWDTTAAPYLGLWLSRGGYRGWHHVALEPTNAPYDRANEAAADPRFTAAVILPPGAHRTWWVEWRVT